MVLAAEPYRRLSYTWHTFDFRPSPRPWTCPAEQVAAWAAEPRSTVTFKLEPTWVRSMKLTVVHDGFPPNSRAAELVSNGWPQVLSGLKTLLETGETISIKTGSATASVAR